MATPDTGMVIIVAAFATDPDRLFHALSEPAEILRWWGGRRSGSFVTWTGRAETGGLWQAQGVFSGGRSFFVSGAFIEVEGTSRIVQSWHASWDEMIATESSIRIEPSSSGAVLTLVHKGFLGRDPACQAQAQLWWRVVKWLRSYLQGDDSPAIPPDSMTSG